MCQACEEGAARWKPFGDCSCRQPLVHRRRENCHLGLGKLYRRTGKREQAQEHLTTAATMYLAFAEAGAFSSTARMFWRIIAAPQCWVGRIR